MKRPAMFGLTLSLFAFNAFALPAEDEPTPMAQPAAAAQSQLAEDGFDRTPGSQFVAEGGADRLAERNKHAS